MRHEDVLNLLGMPMVVLAMVLTLVSLDWLATDGLRLFRQWRQSLRDAAQQREHERRLVSELLSQQREISRTLDRLEGRAK